MKNLLKYLALISVTLFFAFAFAAPAFAGDSATTPASAISASNIVTWLTPIIVPLVIAGAKHLAPSIPSWALPIIAPVLGVIVDIINSLAAGQQSNLIVAALLGLAGIGVREVKDQLTPAKPAEGSA